MTDPKTPTAPNNATLSLESSGSLGAARSSVIRFAIIATIVWSTVSLLTVFWSYHRERGLAKELASKEALALFKKDLAFRKWATAHGGVYVKPDSRTPPNPYLGHLPNRDVLTSEGQELTLMNPAYMMRQMTTEFQKAYGIRGHITSLVLLNPINEPDGWERLILEQYETNPREVISEEIIEGDPYMRLMRPMFMTKGCVKCHGHLGFKDGDLRGGISVAVPLASYYLAADTSTRNVIVITALLWLLGVIGLIIHTRDRLAQIGVLADNTQRLETEVKTRFKAERALEKANTSLQSKNTELEQIVYVTSHDLRSPLVNIQGYGKELAFSLKELHALLKDEAIPVKIHDEMGQIVDEDIPDALDFIQHSTKKMDGLLSGLLKISRLGRAGVTIEEVDATSVAKQAAKDFEFQLDEHKITLDIQPLPNCHADVMQLNQIFSNLIANSIKYRTPDQSGKISITGEIQGKFAVYTVKDNGIGIAESHLARIFDIFHRLHPETSDGEGIGLTIVQRALDRLNGEISVTSTLGEGSAFQFRLPLTTSKIS
ncbi:ATP-binding protein [Magnetococcus sp. PR-3]|uniref:ATP-binding protein n=1 Tax=Magnetococcus sp. PR-3 TaxID=3120355 RepID=UPI002FCE2867